MCTCVILREKGWQYPSRYIVYTTCAELVGVRPSDTRPPGIRLPVIISPCQSPGPKGDIYTRHRTTNHPWTFPVCVIVIIRVIFFETIFFFPDLTSSHVRWPASLFVSEFQKPPIYHIYTGYNRGKSTLKHFVYVDYY